MGFKISWIGFHGISKEQALARSGLVDTGLLDEANEVPFSGAEIPDSWFVLFSNDFEYVSDERLSAMSGGCRVVACQIHEGIMVSMAYGYEHGKQIWALTHDADRGIYDLSVSGSPPAIYEAIRQRLVQEQDARGGRAAGVDYVFDIPVETAAALCNYRHDRWKFDWGEPKFTQLEVAKSAPTR